MNEIKFTALVLADSNQPVSQQCGIALYTLSKFFKDLAKHGNAAVASMDNCVTFEMCVNREPGDNYCLGDGKKEGRGMTDLEITVVNSVIDRLDGVAGKLKGAMTSYDRIESLRNKEDVGTALKETKDAIRWLTALVEDK